MRCLVHITWAALQAIFRSLIIGGSITTAVFGEENAAGPISSWQAFEKEIVHATLPDSFGYKSLMKIPRFRLVNQLENEAIWYEMKSMNRRPLLVAAAFYCFKQHRPEKALLVAMEMLLARPNDVTLQFYDDLFAELSAADPTGSVFAALDVCARSDTAANDSRFALITGALSDPTISQWYFATDETLLHPSCEAIIIERLYSIATRNRSNVAEKAKQRMRRLALCPGLPRMTFVRYSEESDASFDQVFKLVLSDEDESMGAPFNEILLVQCVRQYPGRTMDVLSSKAISISDTRRKLLEKALKSRQ